MDFLQGLFVLTWPCNNPCSAGRVLVAARKDIRANRQRLAHCCSSGGHSHGPQSAGGPPSQASISGSGCPECGSTSATTGMPPCCSPCDSMLLPCPLLCQRPDVCTRTGGFICGLCSAISRDFALLQAYLVGLTFALAASPCSTPVLATLLAYVSTSQDPLLGGSLLLAYTLG